MISPPSHAGEAPRLSTSTPAPARARVIAVEDPAATDAYKPNAAVIRHLVQRGITNFTAQGDVVSAWRSIVKTNETVALKVFSAPGPQVGTRPPVVEGVIEGLLSAGVPSNHIVVWDRRLSDLRRAGFGELSERYGVALAGSVESGWDTNAFYDSPILGQLVFGDLEFQPSGERAAGVGRKSYVTRLLTTNAPKVINISPLLNHNSAGVCGNLFSLAIGSVDNVIRFEGEQGKLATAVPEIYALPTVGDRVVLNIVDALICQYQGEQIGHLHYSAPLNQLRFSKDPVALDVLSITEIDRQRARTFPELTKTNRLELYRNAELLELGIAEPSRIDLLLK